MLSYFGWQNAGKRWLVGLVFGYGTACHIGSGNGLQFEPFFGRAI